MDNKAMYCAEQINIPLELGAVLKQFTKAVILEEPNELYKWSANYFAQLAHLPVIFGPEGEYLDGVKAGQKPKGAGAAEEVEDAAPSGEEGSPREGADQQAELVNEIFSAYNTEDGRITQDVVMAIFSELQEKLGFEMTQEDADQYMDMLAKDEAGHCSITDVYNLFFQNEQEAGDEEQIEEQIEEQGEEMGEETEEPAEESDAAPAEEVPEEAPNE